MRKLILQLGAHLQRHTLAAHARRTHNTSKLKRVLYGTSATVVLTWGFTWCSHDAVQAWVVVQNSKVNVCVWIGDHLKSRSLEA